MIHWRKTMLSTLCSLLVLGQTIVPTHASEAVHVASVKAHHAQGYEPEHIIDGKLETSWRSMPQNGEGDRHQRMLDHNRTIDLTLDGTYQIDGFQVYTECDQSYSQYYIYVSKDGENYTKVVSKTDRTQATPEGTTHTLTTPVEASYVRVSMAYNSRRYETNLSEFKITGTKVNNHVPKAKPIEVENWQGSSWQQEWDKVKTDEAYASDKLIREMKAMVGRVLGQQWQDSFVFKQRQSLQEGKDIFEIKNGDNGTIVISGNNGIALASGFNYYLKNYLYVDYNPLFESQVHVDAIVPVTQTEVREAQFNMRYALNFCTYSYTMAFWNWDEYEAFIDWAAMNGINLMLDIVGQEEVLRQTLREYHFTDEEIKDYLVGPAYVAWFYMQNLYSSGGPLPNAWFSQRVELGRQMHDRMQIFGIQPIIQAFAGQVPDSFAKKNEGAVLTPIDEWVGYTRPSIIKTYLTAEDKNAGKKNYFSQVAETFYEKQKNVFGDVSNYYAADPFHEGGNTGGLDVANIYKTVQDELLKSNPKAVWVMQQWQGNLNDQKMSLMDRSKAIALDLQADMNPQHQIFENNGTPWIYCMLHNFGGRMGLDGELPVIAEDQITTLQQSKQMVGIGMTPEALENSPVVYELFFDTTWSKDPINVNTWLEGYAKRRAGGTSESLVKAWNILLETAYADKKNYIQGAAETVVNARPSDSFHSASTWGHSTIEYDMKRLDEAIVLLADNYEAFQNSPAFCYDLADVAEQVLSNAATKYHQAMVQAKNNKDLTNFEMLSTKFLALIDLSDKILSTSKEFLVGTWIEDARNMLSDADDWTKDLMEFNARSLITTWGGERVGSLKDYSNRKWAGLTSSFYKPRWEIWIDNRLRELKGEAKDPSHQQAENNWFLWEFEWANRKSDDGFQFPTEATNHNLKELAMKAYNEFSITNFKGELSTKENILKSKLFTSNDNQEHLDHLTDGTTSTQWETSSTNEVTLNVDLGGVYRMDQFMLSFPQLAKDFPYTYKVEVYHEGTWKEVAKNGEKVSSNEAIHVSCVGSQLRLTLQSTDTASETLKVTEIQAFGEAVEVEKKYNVALGLIATTNKNNTDPSYPLSHITDDNDDNLWKTQDWGHDAYPAYIQLDLPKTTEVCEVQVVFEKTELPFKFTLKGIKPDGKEVIINDTYANHTGTLSQKSYSFTTNEVLKAVRLDYHGITGQGPASAAGPALSELRVFTTKPTIEGIITNVPLKADFQDAYKVIDGNKDTFAKVENNGQDYIFHLPSESYIDEAIFTFEKGELGLKYQVWIEKADGTKEIVSDQKENNQLLGQRDVRVPIRKEATKVIFKHFGNNGQGNAPQAEARLYEVAVQGYTLDSIGTIPATKLPLTAHFEASDKVLDGNPKSYALVNNQGEPIEFNLEDSYYVNEAVITFEKAGLGLKYQVLIETEDGKQEVILDKKDTQELLDKPDVHVTIGKEAKKIILKHFGNNGKGDAYLAEPRLYEVEVFGRLSPTYMEDIEAGAYQALFDGNLDTTKALEANTSFEVTLPKAVDLLYLSLHKVQGDIDLSVEAMVDGAYVSFGNAQSSTGDQAVIAGHAVYTNKLRFTASQATELREIQWYVENQHYQIKNRLNDIQKILDAIGRDGYNGDYTKEAIDQLESVLDTIRHQYQGVVNREEAKEALDTVNTALKVFYTTGRIYIERHALLAELSYVDALVKALDKLNQQTAKVALEATYKEALEVFNTYRVTQAQVDAATRKLQDKSTSALETLEAADRFNVQLQAAKTFLDHMVVGEYGGNYSQATKDTLEETLAIIEMDSQVEDVDYAPLLQRLEEALENAKQAVVVIDRQALEAQIETSKATITHPQHDYDFEVYTVYQNALKEALALKEAATTTMTQEMVTQATTTLAQATLTLEKARLNYEPLIQAIEKVKMQDLDGYTMTSVEAFKQAFTSAKDCLASDENTQGLIDKCVNALEEAMAYLEVDRSKLQSLVDTHVSLEHKQQSYIDAYQKAVTQALTVLEKDNVTKEEVALAIDTLQKAIDALNNAPIVNKEQLQQAIETMVDLQGKPLHLVDVYQKALDAAKQVMAYGEATQVHVDEALAALTNAINSLEAIKGVNRIELQHALAHHVDLSGKPSHLIKAYEKAMKHAQAVEADLDASQEIIDEAAFKLKEAIEALETYVVDTPELPHIILTANKTQLVIGEKAQLTVQPSGVKVTYQVENDDVLSVDAQGVVTALNVGVTTVSAVSANKNQKPASITFVVLNKNQSIDKDALKDLIDRVDGIQKDHYSKESYEAYLQAFTKAKAILENNTATQEQVTKAFNDLQNAYNNLVASNDSTVPTSDQQPVALYGMVIVITLAMLCLLVYNDKKNSFHKI